MDDESETDEAWQELSLEELGKAYAQAIGQGHRSGGDQSGDRRNEH